MCRIINNNKKNVLTFPVAITIFTPLDETSLRAFAVVELI